MNIQDTELHTWFERDRAHVELRHIASQDTLFEAWDGEVAELVEDGFLNPRDWHGSAYEHAQACGLLDDGDSCATIRRAELRGQE